MYFISELLAYFSSDWNIYVVLSMLWGLSRIHPNVAEKAEKEMATAEEAILACMGASLYNNLLL